MAHYFGPHQHEAMTLHNFLERMHLPKFARDRISAMLRRLHEKEADWLALLFVTRAGYGIEEKLKWHQRQAETWNKIQERKLKRTGFYGLRDKLQTHPYGTALFPLNSVVNCNRACEVLDLVLDAGAMFEAVSVDFESWIARS